MVELQHSSFITIEMALSMLGLGFTAWAFLVGIGIRMVARIEKRVSEDVSAIRMTLNDTSAELKDMNSAIHQIQLDYGPRMTAIDTRLTALATEASTANTNAKQALDVRVEHGNELNEVRARVGRAEEAAHNAAKLAQECAERRLKELSRD